MDQSRGVGILSAAILLLTTGLVCSEEPKLVSLNDIPAMSIPFLLGPWANESQIPPDRRSGCDLIRIEVQPGRTTVQDVVPSTLYVD